MHDDDRGLARVPRVLATRSIQVSIALSFSIVILLTILAMGVIAYTLTENALKNYARNYTLQLIGQANSSIRSYVTYMENIASVVDYNKDVQGYFARARPLDGAQGRADETKIGEFLNSIALTRGDISLIMVVGSDGRYIAQDPTVSLNPAVSITDQKWYRDAIEARGRAVISSSHVENIIRDEYRWVISLSQQIVDPETRSGVAVLLVDLNFSVISDLCSSIDLGRKGYVFIVDGDGQIVYHPQQQLIYSSLKDERIAEVLGSTANSFVIRNGSEEIVYTIERSANTGWIIVGVNPIEGLISNRQAIQLYYTAWGIGCFMVIILLSIVISSRITKPIKVLRQSMRSVESGNFDVSAAVESGDEIGALWRDYNIMIAKIKDLVRQTILDQEQKRKSELRALQNQITPHFLYNTLDSIIWMAESNRQGDVVRMVSALAKLLRLSISKGEELVSIRDEVEHIKNYLTIQKMRYKDKLDFMLDVDEEILGLRTLKVILQPLVENAIYHGIKNKPDAGTIRIAGRRANGKVHLSIEDDGVGMSTERLARIFTLHRDGSDRRGVGVSNVNERIKLYFGPEYGLEYASEEDRGTTVSIWLPVIGENERS